MCLSKITISSLPLVFSFYSRLLLSFTRSIVRQSVLRKVPSETKQASWKWHGKIFIIVYLLLFHLSRRWRCRKRLIYIWKFSLRNEWKLVALKRDQFSVIIFSFFLHFFIYLLSFFYLFFTVTERIIVIANETKYLFLFIFSHGWLTFSTIFHIFFSFGQSQRKESW